MRDLTPKRDHQYGNSRSKSKNNTNISTKCSDSAFTQVSEDVPVETPIDFSCALSTISEEREESWISSFSPPATPFPAAIKFDETPTSSPVSTNLFDQTPTSTITSEKDESRPVQSFNGSPTPLALPLSVQSDPTPLPTEGGEVKSSVDSVSSASLEAEMVVSYLKQARSEVDSSNISALSKKILDKMLEVAMEDLIGLPEEKDGFAELCSKKSRVVLLSFFLWITFAVIFFFCHGNESSSVTGLVPT